MKSGAGGLWESIKKKKQIYAWPTIVIVCLVVKYLKGFYHTECKELNWNTVFLNERTN